MLTPYYAFVVSSGTFKVTPWNTDYYDLLAAGFDAGHLHLPLLPHPLLLAQPDPYNVVNRALWLWDVSLYKGHFYLNWGPVPALCLWFFKLFTGYRTTVHDQWLVLVFSLIRLYAGSALIVSYARAQAPSLPNWALQLAVLVFGLASPTPFFLARPLVYEAAIASGQAFMFLGLCCAFWGLRSRRARLPLFVLAGVCFALAFGSRAPMLVAIPLVVLATALIARRRDNRPAWPFLHSTLALGVPTVVAVVAYAIYNQQRFDSPTEFGLKYILSVPQFVTDTRWILPNLMSYLTSDIAWSCNFPFVTLPIQRQLSSLIEWPVDYNLGNYPMGERAGGVLVATSICWLWVVWLWRAAGSGIDRLLQRRSQPRWSQRELWCVGCSLALLCAIAPASRMWMANMRFLEDVSGGLLLGSVAAGFWLLTRTRRGLPRGLATLSFAGLALYSIVVGVCLGFTGHIENFGRQNPALFAELVRRLSLCP